MAVAKSRLYDKNGVPCKNFNRLVLSWLDGAVSLREHAKPAAFEGIKRSYLAAIDVALSAGSTHLEAHRLGFSRLTELLFGHDLAKELGLRLNAGLVNQEGFRTTLSQGVAKNIGENFVNLIIYGLVEVLKDQDEILVDKGMPPKLKAAMELKRRVPLKNGFKDLRIPIEGDFSIFHRDDPFNSIVVSAKTRLKEVFHIGTMWKILFDMIGDEHCMTKWGLGSATNDDLSKVLYVFATADMVRDTGVNSQGPDVERDEPRNLIAMDASFFDYVFVSKSGIPHVGSTISLNERGALFHELGCILDLVSAKFGVKL